jgi:arylsulfatase A-like enzyme
LYGILAIRGKGIKENYRIKNAHIIDLAPTILHMFGLPVPKYMDGRVLTEIFKPDSEFARRKVKYSSYEKVVIRDKIRRLKAGKKL